MHKCKAGRNPMPIRRSRGWLGLLLTAVAWALLVANRYPQEHSPRLVPGIRIGEDDKVVEYDWLRLPLKERIDST